MPDDRGRHKGPARAVPSNTTATAVRLRVTAAISPARRVASNSTRLTANPAGRSPRRTFLNHHCRSSPSSKNLPPNRLSAPINRGRQLLGSPRTTTTELSSLLYTGAPPPQAPPPPVRPFVEPPLRAARAQGEHGDRFPLPSSPFCPNFRPSPSMRQSASALPAGRQVVPPFCFGSKGGRRRAFCPYPLPFSLSPTELPPVYSLSLSLFLSIQTLTFKLYHKNNPAPLQ
jgi:hypothetical protein